MLLRNRIRTHSGRAFVFCPFAMALCLFALLVSFAPMHARAQDDSTAPEQHGRKYKAPPDTSRIEVTVLKGFNKKPIMNAAVVFHPVKDGRDEGNMEMKTDPDGKAVIDVIPTGSKVTIQVIADGFRHLRRGLRRHKRPAARSSSPWSVRRHRSPPTSTNTGKPAELKPGVQEPVRPRPSRPRLPLPQQLLSRRPRTPPRRNRRDAMNRINPCIEGMNFSLSFISGDRLHPQF